MLEALAGVLAGVAAGALTGTIPGLHVNTLLSLLSPLLFLGAEHHRFSLAFIVAMSVTHSFVSYVPSILLSAPQEDTALSVLPGQRLLAEGRGYEAVYLTVLGGAGSMLVLLLLLPLLIWQLPSLYRLLKPAMGAVLLLVLAYMVASERDTRRRLYALVVVLLSGTMGYIILNRLQASPERMLFPALTGMFGVSTMLAGVLSGRLKMPEQSTACERRRYLRGMLTGALAGAAAGILPGVGAAQSTYLVQGVLGRRGAREFLVAQGGVNTVMVVVSVLTLYLIHRPRSGTGIAVEKLLTLAHGSTPTWRELRSLPGYSDFLLVVAAAFLATALGGGLTLAIARACITGISGISLSPLYSCVVLLLAAATLVYSGVTGLLVLVTATSIGMLAISTGVKRSHGMGVLILPAMLHFIFER